MENSWKPANSRTQKNFNKGFMDLKTLAIVRIESGQARFDRDYSAWVDRLLCWMNLLSPVMKPEEIDAFEAKIKSVEQYLLSATANKNSVKWALHKLERELIKIEDEARIGNPSKDGDSVDFSYWDKKFAEDDDEEVKEDADGEAA